MNEPPSSLPPIRILLVEDSADDAELIEMALRRSGIAFTMARVENESEFVEHLEAEAPDLILCDYHLPRFSALRAFDILRERSLQLPVVVVSRHISAQERTIVLGRGAVQCVGKHDLSPLASAVMCAVPALRR